MTKPTNPRRREFLLRAGLASTACLLPRLSDAQTHLAFTPAAFDARSDSVLIWAGHNAPIQVQIQYHDASTTTYVNGPRIDLSERNGYCNHAQLTNLSPGRRYHYRIIDAQTGTILTETGSFKTAPSLATEFSFIFSADISEGYKPYTLFTQMSQVNPDFLLLLGDTAYADYPGEFFKPSLTYYRGKHATIRRDTQLQQFLANHVTYAVWDDHEVENNFHAQHPHLTEGLQAFRDYWPGLTVQNSALYRQFSWSSVDFFILDTRRFRSPQAMEDGPAKTMLGKEQKDWFKTALKASTAPFKFVITSVPFHGGSSDTWGNYAHERDELEWFIHQEKIAGVMLLTGDYHLARVFNTDVIELREFMAGPIASFSHFKRLPQRREIYQRQGGFFYGDGPNFGYWRINPNTGAARLEYKDIQGKTLFSGEFNA